MSFSTHVGGQQGSETDVSFHFIVLEAQTQVHTGSTNMNTAARSANAN
jgi:hypothetical protein